jgi:hypothetical protein
MQVLKQAKPINTRGCQSEISYAVDSSRLCGPVRVQLVGVDEKTDKWFWHFNGILSLSLLYKYLWAVPISIYVYQDCLLQSTSAVKPVFAQLAFSSESPKIGKCTGIFPKIIIQGASPCQIFYNTFFVRYLIYYTYSIWYIREMGANLLRHRFTIKVI